MIIAVCPECKAEVSITPKPRIGMQLACPQCSTELEIIWLFPPMLDFCEPANSINQSQVLTGRCPKCKAEVLLGGKPNVGTRVRCLLCDHELEIIWLFPPMLEACDRSDGTYPHQQKMLDPQQL